MFLKMPSLGDWLTRVFFVACSAAFFIQVNDMCAKFLAGETTVFSQFRDDVPLTWPTVILCPDEQGYKPGAVEGLGPYQWNVDASEAAWDSYVAPESPEQMEQWFEASTYSPEEIVTDITHYDGGGNLIKDVHSLDEIGSVYWGRCAKLNFSEPLSSPRDYVHLDISVPPGGLVAYALVEANARFGITVNFWINEEYWSFPVKPRRAYGLGIIKSTLTDEETTRCNEEATEDSDGGLGRMVKCYESQLAVGLGKGKEDCKVCYHPAFKHWINANKTGPCRAIPDLKRTRNAVTDSLGLLGVANCPRQCEKLSFEYRMKSRPRDEGPGGENRTIVGMYYLNARVETKMIKRIHDAGSIVAGVGGSLGLFLGFSCMDFFRTAVSCAATRASKILGKGRIHDHQTS